MAARNLVRCLIFFCLASVLLAQTSGTSGLTGTVTDQTGAVVPNVTVTATNIANNSVRTAVTGADGTYRFTLLPPGTYRVSFASSGFKAAEVTAVTLDVTQTPVVDQKLEVGAQSDRVTVEASVETLQTTSSSLGTTIGSRQVTELPLSSRNFTQILGLSAGASAPVNNATAFGKGSLDIAVNGNDTMGNNFQMDGVAVNNIANGGSVNDSGIYGGIGIPSPDALQEFRIQTSTYDASYGRNAGANVNVVTKSGTNAFHGTAFEFFRNAKLNANGFFYNRNICPVTYAGESCPKQILNQNQYGGVIGGPIKKDKIFFFASYEGLRNRNGISPEGNSSGLILPPIPGGNGTDRTSPQFLQQLIKDNCGPAFPTGLPKSLGPNFLPCSATTVSGPALAILQLKNSNGSYYIPGTNDQTVYNAGFSIPSASTENQGLLNGDYLINSKNTLAMRYFYSSDPRTIPFPQFGNQLPGDPQSTYNSNTDAVVRLTTIVSNTFLNEIRGSFQRNLSVTSDAGPAGDTPAELGIKPLVNGFALPPPILFAVDNFSIFGHLVDPTYSPTNQFQVADQISWSHGKHTIRAGFENEWTQYNLVFPGLERGAMVMGTFQDLLVGGPGTGLGNAPDAPQSNFLTCVFCVRSGPKGIVHGYRLPNRNAFVQDDWKVSPKLTLNIGLRWEFDGEISDKYGNLTDIWVSQLGPNSAIPSAPLGIAANYAGYVVPCNFSTATWGPIPPGIERKCSDPLTNHVPWSNFAPRIGTAYQINSKLVLRAGAGLFYNRVGLNEFFHSVQEGNPYAATVALSNQSTINNPYPAQPAYGTFGQRWVNFAANCTSEPCTSGLNHVFLYERLHTPLTRSYNVNLQYEIVPRLVLEMAYVGSSSINLTDYNHNYNTAFIASAANPVNGITTTTVANANLRVPYLGFSANGLQGAAEDGKSNYNSLQVTLRKQLSHGISFQASYTYSKSLSNIEDFTANSNNASNLNQQYGPTNFNRPQRLVINYSWDLPLYNRRGLVGAILGGWNVSGVTTVQDGTPLMLYDASGGTAYGIPSQNNDSFGYSRPEICPGMTYGNIASSGGVESRLNGYWNTSAFCGPPAILPDGTTIFHSTATVSAAAQCQAANGGSPCATLYGNAGAGIIKGPGQFNFDTAFLKTTHVTENVVVQFRAEFFNLFNHPQFSNPVAPGSSDNTLADVHSGNRIVDTSVGPRVIQFGVKVIF
jgi:hypothetical protein